MLWALGGLLLALLSASVDVNVHIVEHTHDDVGWQTTVDGYYTERVRNILNLAYEGLMANPERRYTYVEIAFFQLWWNEQSDTIKNNVKKLVAEGRLEFTNAGWCMNDEAAAHYTDIIDQMALGHIWLQAQFGNKVIPTIGWQIDPFGHTSSMAWMFAKMGFNAFQFGRAPQGWPNPTQVVWRPFKSFSGSSQLQQEQQIFTYYHDGYCMSPPKNIGDPTAMRKFAEDRINEAKAMQTPNVIQMYGCDFATPTFDQADKLVEYFSKNTHLGVKVFYSTPSTFYKYINAANATFPAFDPPDDDFFPYWTGFFTSQQTFKRIVRVSSAYFHASTALQALAPRQTTWQDQLKELNVLWMAMGVTQHHDAVTGTSRPFVYWDTTKDCYTSRLLAGQEKAGGVVGSLTDAMTNGHGSTMCEPGAYPQACTGTSTGKEVVVSVFNSLGWKREDYVRIPVPNGTTTWSVTDHTGADVPCQLGMFNQTLQAIWLASGVPPAGVVTYKLTPSGSGCKMMMNPATTKQPKSGFTLENELLEVSFNSQGGLQFINNKKSNVQVMGTAEVLWYKSAADGNDGAYDFKANPTTAKQFPGAGQGTPVFKQGELYSELTVPVDSASHVVQQYRLYKGMSHLEILTQVGPVDIFDNIGKDIILRMNTSIQSQGTWYTDSSGMEMMQRTLGLWKNGEKPGNRPGKNYYPMTALSYVKDTNAQLVMFTDRSEGCGSQGDGALEAMIYRRLLKGDGKGMGTPLNTTTPIITSHWITVDTPSGASHSMRPDAQRVYHPLVLTVSPTGSTSAPWSPLSSLPPNVHLQNLQTILTNWSAPQCPHCPVPPPSGHHNPPDQPADPTSLPDGHVLLRLAHIYGIHEDAELSKPATVDLDALFKDHTVNSMEEYTLTTTQPLASEKRLPWNVADLNKCAWRQTGDCKSDGPREPWNDKQCDVEISGRASGYCECPKGHQVHPVNCGHPTFKCSDYCHQNSPSLESPRGAHQITISPMDVRTFVLDLVPKTKTP